MHGIHSTFRMVLAAGLVIATGILIGCDNLARSQGKFPIASSFGSTVLSDESVPLNPNLFVPRLDENGNEKEKTPLVRVAYRSPWDGDLVNTTHAKGWDKQSYYMVVDVTNVARDPSLRCISDPVQRRAAIRAIADSLVVAADWNGDVYWRHLTTFLEVYKAGNTAAKTLYGGAIAGTFISPVLGASLAGGALVIDSTVAEYTGNLDVDDYAKLRQAASIKRIVLKDKLFEAVDNMGNGKETMNTVLALAYDYAFTYSIKGALNAVVDQNTKLEEFLLTGESSWTPHFSDAIDRIDEDRIRRDVYKGEEKARVEARIAKNKQAQADRATADKEAEKVAAATALAKAKKAQADAEREAAEAETKKLEAERVRDNLKHGVAEKAPEANPAPQKQEDMPPFETVKPAK